MLARLPPPSPHLECAFLLDSAKGDDKAACAVAGADNGGRDRADTTFGDAGPIAMPRVHDRSDVGFTAS
jgi:hypothetical protein